ncbi:MAG: DNA-3-methyladenine glycosylase family protein [Planctomycetaceae bacterium]
MSFSPDHIARALRHLRQSDPVLAEVIRRVGPFELQPKRGRFQSLVRSILAQQISTAVARSMVRKLEARLAPNNLTPASLGQLSFDELRAIGLSRQKATYLQDLTEKVASKTVRLHRVHRLTDEEIIAELIQVKGIGRWTVQMFLIFCLGRPDVFAPDDFGLRSAIQRLYGLPELPKRAEAEEIAAPWRPHATVASWYLWRSLELPQD